MKKIFDLIMYWAFGMLGFYIGIFVITKDWELSEITYTGDIYETDSTIVRRTFVSIDDAVLYKMDSTVTNK